MCASKCNLSVKKNLTDQIKGARALHGTMMVRMMETPGDSVGAMCRLEEKFGLSYWRQWALRHHRRATPDFLRDISRAYREVLEFAVERDTRLINGYNATRQPVAERQSTITEMLLTAEAYRMRRSGH